MELGWAKGRLWEAPADTLVVLIEEDEGGLTGPAALVDEAGGGLLAQARDAGMLDGRRDACAVLPTYGRLAAARVVVAGLGPHREVDAGRLRRAVAVAARAARRAGARRMAVDVREGERASLAAQEAAQALALGMAHGLWRYDGYRTQPLPHSQVEAVTVVGDDEGPLQDGLAMARVVHQAVSLTRELAVLGSNDKYPERVAQRAEAYAAQVGMEVSVLDERELAEMGAGAILGVGQGSTHPPRMVVLRVPGKKADAPVLGLVGKGITFDSGGISLKPAQGMEEMKYDLCGAAAILGAMGALAQLGSPIPVVAVLCLAENLPSGSAQRPGDVVRTLDGQTVEVVNTDAEGRLVMADGMALARRLGATHLVDAATLTGACVVALGHAYSGLMATDDGLARAVEEAARRSAEKVWRLPLTDPMYEDALRSYVADVKNTGGREAGAITAGVFLRRFTGGLPWVHLDIAGTAWLTEEVPFQEVGPTGAMCETFLRLPFVLAQG